MQHHLYGHEERGNVTQGQNHAAGDDRRRDHARNPRTHEPPPSPQQPAAPERRRQARPVRAVQEGGDSERDQPRQDLDASRPVTRWGKFAAGGGSWRIRCPVARPPRSRRLRRVWSGSRFRRWRRRELDRPRGALPGGPAGACRSWRRFCTAPVAIGGVGRDLFDRRRLIVATAWLGAVGQVEGRRHGATELIVR
jgi:hypothetical protein